jgi:hypothetical protein
MRDGVLSVVVTVGCQVALSSREAALDAREAALSAREAAVRGHKELSARFKAS